MERELFPKKNNSETILDDRGIGFSYECERRKKREFPLPKRTLSMRYVILSIFSSLVGSPQVARATERCARSRERWDQMVKKYTR